MSIPGSYADLLRMSDKEWGEIKLGPLRAEMTGPPLVYSLSGKAASGAEKHDLQQVFRSQKHLPAPVVRWGEQYPPRAEVRIEPGPGFVICHDPALGPDSAAQVLVVNDSERKEQRWWYARDNEFLVAVEERGHRFVATDRGCEHCGASYAKWMRVGFSCRPVERVPPAGKPLRQVLALPARALTPPDRSPLLGTWR